MENNFAESVGNFELTDDIRKVFEQHLPGMASGALLKFINEANELKQTLVKQKESYQKLQEAYNIFSKTNTELHHEIQELNIQLNQFKKREIDLINKELSVKEDRFQLDLELMKIKLSCKDEIIANQMETIRLFTKNPVYQKSILENNSNFYNKPRFDQNGYECGNEFYNKSETKNKDITDSIKED